MTWKPEAGKPAMVMVTAIDRHNDIGIYLKGPHGSSWANTHGITFSEPPTPISPEQLAVIEAAKNYWKRPSHQEATALLRSVDDLAASEAPPDPKAELLAAAKLLLLAWQTDTQWSGAESAIVKRAEAAVRAVEADDGR